MDLKTNNMKKITYLLLALIGLMMLLPFVSDAQKRRVGEYYHVGAPTFSATGVNDLSIDTKNGQVWEYFTKSTSLSIPKRWRMPTGLRIT